MNNQIASKDQIEKEAEDMQSYLEITCSEDPAEVEDRGYTLSVYMARSGKLLADAKVHKDRAMTESILKQLNVSLPASVMNKLVDSQCHDENYLVNWLDRINRTCSHQMDWLRSTLSKAKEEMRQSNWGNQRQPLS